MSYIIIFVALITAFLLTLLFSRSFSNKGPFGGLLLFFLIIFLSTWSGQLWVQPVTKPIWGIDWGLLLFTATIFSVMMMALSTPVSKDERDSVELVNKKTGIAVGLFFWILIILLIIAVGSGYYKGLTFHSKPDMEATI